MTPVWAGANERRCTKGARKRAAMHLSYQPTPLSRVTGSTARLYPSEAHVVFRGKRSKTMADQLTTVSKKRLINKAGSLSSADMQGVARAISTQLDIAAQHGDLKPIEPPR